MSTIDDLLSRRRRGALSEADERRVQMTVHTSDEHRLTLLAGEVFERAGAAQSGDAALVKSIVRQVEGEWSGTFQRVVARRRLSRWVSVPVLIAGVAAASLGGYRALHGPTENAQPGALAARSPVASSPVARSPVASSPVVSSPAASSPVAHVSVGQPAAPSLAEWRAQAPATRQMASVGVVPATEPPAPAEVFAESPAAIAPALLTPLALEEPATTPSALAVVAAVPELPVAAPAPAASVPAAAAELSAPSRSWRLPRPKPHAERTLAAADHDLDLAAAAPALAAPVAAAGRGELEPLPDLESSPVLFRRANQLRRTDWDAAASLYERLALRHSESREAGVAEMALAKHALGEGRARQALHWFEAYQRRTGGELAAEAVWGAARALESLGENERARELWRRLIEQYPASAYAAAAREQLGP
jgi:TolA-binding protein